MVWERVFLRKILKGLEELPFHINSPAPDRLHPEADRTPLPKAQHDQGLRGPVSDVHFLRRAGENCASPSGRSRSA